MQIKQNETEKLLIFLAFTIELYSRRNGVCVCVSLFKYTELYKHNPHKKYTIQCECVGRANRNAKATTTK